METQNRDVLLSYFDKVRERTMRLARCVPPDRLDWTCRPNQFTLGDLLRHLAVTERFTFAEALQDRPNRYPGCGKELADGYNAVIALMEKLHHESREIFCAISEEAWDEKCLTPDSAPIRRWKLFRAMIEHEIHHRGQIYVYLGILGVPTPPLYGLTSEQLRQRAAAM
jgi:uncharacterized damage-inducible protein DinB